MPPRVQIPDDEEFRKMWAGEMTLQQIAGHYGLKYGSTVSKAAIRYNLPPRTWRRSGVSGPPRKTMSGQVRDDVVLDSALEQKHADDEARRADGLVDRLVVRGIAPKAATGLAIGLVRARLYIDLEQLAERHGQPLTRLLPLWHEVRT